VLSAALPKTAADGAGALACLSQRYIAIGLFWYWRTL
jgi:hypothetical protein